jgi:antitoxin YefM
MDARTIDDARQKPDELMDQAVDTAEPIIITRTGKAPVVLVSLAGWTSLKEMVHLIRSPANRDRLQRAMRDANDGLGVERQLAGG